MSLTSSETAITVTPPKIVYLFLAKFDAKEGYKMVWESPHAALDSSGLEYKALPSGVHEYEATNVFLAHESHGKLFYGSARFRQTNGNVDGGSDRLLVKMYSLGILVEPLKGKPWKAHEFSNFGWEHFGALDAALLSFMKTEDVASLEQAFLALSGKELVPDIPRPHSGSQADHPLSKLPQALQTLGPLIFPVFKAALLRKNILIFNHSSQGAAQLKPETSPHGPAACGALAFLISLLSIIPKYVKVDALSGVRDASLDDKISFSQPLFTVGLQDLNTDFFRHYPGFVASTSDEILKYQKQLYDIAVVMPASEYDTCRVFASSNLDEPVKATYKDYGKFLKVYNNLPQCSNSRRDSAGDDQALIGTSSSFLSSLRIPYFGDSKQDNLSREPAWWCSEASSPVSWREFIWLAFTWFASAGSSERERESAEADVDTEDMPEEYNNFRSDMLQLTAIVGQFHKLTKKWFFIIEEIIADTYNPSGGKLTLQLTPHDIVDMELDPYSAQDLEFLREFVATYWGETVDGIEFGFGIYSFFC